MKMQHVGLEGIHRLRDRGVEFAREAQVQATRGGHGAEFDAGRKPAAQIRRRFGARAVDEELTRAGGTVEQIVVYTSRDVDKPDDEIAALLRAGKIDWVTVTSSAIARSLVRLFGDDLRRTRLATISPLTTSALAELGHRSAAEAARYTTAGLVDAILNATGRAPDATPKR